MVSVTIDAMQQATAMTGVKVNAKQAADLRRASEGPKVFIARGGFNV